ncbi:MAG: flagellar export chaperone FliS [Desulfuromonadaceae bacterium]|nr:flagellar export chaperone FliS [Desulfuromonadaceae bacterium]
MNAYMNQYQQNQIDTASREQILIMLYDGAIRFTRQALAAMESGDQKTKREKISRAMAIITEFSNTLDREVGGEIADNLDALYHYMIRELTAANLQNDAAKLTVVDGLLSDLRETWMEAIEIARNEQKPKNPVSNGDHTPLRASL